MGKNMNNLELQKMANEVRKGIITAVHAAKAGHPGGSLSAADMFTYLYFEEMNIDPANPDMENPSDAVVNITSCCALAGSAAQESSITSARNKQILFFM